LLRTPPKWDEYAADVFKELPRAFLKDSHPLFQDAPRATKDLLFKMGVPRLEASLWKEYLFGFNLFPDDVQLLNKIDSGLRRYPPHTRSDRSICLHRSAGAFFCIEPDSEWAIVAYNETNSGSLSGQHVNRSLREFIICAAVYHRELCQWDGSDFQGDVEAYGIHLGAVLRGIDPTAVGPGCENHYWDWLIEDFVNLS
jgi:hypothetical protein